MASELMQPGKTLAQTMKEREGLLKRKAAEEKARKDQEEQAREMREKKKKEADDEIKNFLVCTHKSGLPIFDMEKGKILEDAVPFARSVRNFINFSHDLEIPFEKDPIMTKAIIGNKQRLAREMQEEMRKLEQKHKRS